MRLSTRLTSFCVFLLGALGASVAQAQEVDEARVQKIVSGVCFLCHGMNGESGSEAFPRLAGQHWQYTAKQLEHFQSGQRESSAMAEMAAKLTPEEMVALGKFYEKQTPVSQEAQDKPLAAVGEYIYQHGNRYSGVPACASCHGEDGTGSDSLPRLAGQFAGYLENQLHQFHDRKRTNDNAVMFTITEKMTPLEMAAVAQYLSSR